MANISIDIEDYIDEIETSTLIEELSDRELSADDIHELQSSIGNDVGIDITGGTVMGDMKLEYVMENIGNKTLEEFEEFFKQ